MNNTENDKTNDKAISLLNLVGEAGGTRTPKAMIISQHKGDDGQALFQCVAISRETSLLNKAYKKLTSSVEAYDLHEAEEFLYVEFKNVKRKRKLAVKLNQPLSPDEKAARDVAREKVAGKLAKDQAKADAEAKKVEKAKFETSDAGKKLAAARKLANATVKRRNARIASICKA
jgi:hypothetical protein